MIAANDGGVDISTDGGETWFAPPLPIAQFYHVTADNRDAVPRRRRDAGPRHRAGPEQQPLARAASRSATGTPSAAARPATSVPDPTDPNIVYAGEYRGIITALRPPHAARRATSAPGPTNPSGHGAEDLHVPLPVDGADRDLAARPEDGLPRRQRALPHARRRPDLDAISARPDAQRQDEAEVVRRPDHRRQHRRRDLRHHLRDRRVAAREGRSSGPAATTASSTSRATAARPGRT